MLQKLSDHIRNCVNRAGEARQRAEETVDPRAKADFLRLEQSWNCLARSYQYSQQLERFLITEGSTAIAGWQPIACAPFDREIELAVMDPGGPHALVFPCRRILGNWVDAKSKRRIDVVPTHWREWTELP